MEWHAQQKKADRRTVPFWLPMTCTRSIKVRGPLCFVKLDRPVCILMIGAAFSPSCCSSRPPRVLIGPTVSCRRSQAEHRSQ